MPNSEDIRTFEAEVSQPQLQITRYVYFLKSIDTDKLVLP